MFTAVLLLVGTPTALMAGQAPSTTAAAQFQRVSVTAGRSTTMETTFDITRIAVTNPAIADAVVVRPREILIDGKAAGTISLIVWGGDHRVQYDLVVEQPVSALEQQLQQLFPGERIQAAWSHRHK
jgi:pilus assembly protein CpaC